MNDLLNRIYDFLAEHDLPTMLETIRQLGWREIAGNAFTWLAVAPLLIILIWTKKYKIIVAIVTFFLFLVLLQHTLTPPGEPLPLNNLLTFLGGTAALVGLNLYLIFIRE